ncbi:hypothetical protein ACE7GA_02460 [Roseomonas sp. CCTCC AB2023176]|uniref:hypothetical protein n=1 Tax=Roseomonas sp. CCTCC AB2023176 TaxID=3342640 RepID=UPI0035DFC969
MSNEPTKEPRIPRPPTKEELDRISEQQGMITDEWAPAPRDAERPSGVRAPDGAQPEHGVDGEGI